MGSLYLPVLLGVWIRMSVSQWPGRWRERFLCQRTWMSMPPWWASLRLRKSNPKSVQYLVWSCLQYCTTNRPTSNHICLDVSFHQFNMIHTFTFISLNFYSIHQVPARGGNGNAQRKNAQERALSMAVAIITPLISNDMDFREVVAMLLSR